MVLSIGSCLGLLLESCRPFWLLVGSPLINEGLEKAFVLFSFLKIFFYYLGLTYTVDFVFCKILEFQIN